MISIPTSILTSTLPIIGTLGLATVLFTKLLQAKKTIKTQKKEIADEVTRTARVVNNSMDQISRLQHLVKDKTEELEKAAEENKNLAQQKRYAEISADSFKIVTGKRIDKLKEEIEQLIEQLKKRKSAMSCKEAIQRIGRTSNDVFVGDIWHFDSVGVPDKVVVGIQDHGAPITVNIFGFAERGTISTYDKSKPLKEQNTGKPYLWSSLHSWNRFIGSHAHRIVDFLPIAAYELYPSASRV